jgi:hypothetical protein
VEKVAIRVRVEVLKRDAIWARVRMSSAWSLNDVWSPKPLRLRKARKIMKSCLEYTAKPLPPVFSAPNNTQTKNFSCLQQFHNGSFVGIFLSRRMQMPRVFAFQFDSARPGTISGGKRKPEGK